jgi:hypothetical protein
MRLNSSRLNTSRDKVINNIQTINQARPLEPKVKTINYRMLSEMNSIPADSTLVEGRQEDKIGRELGNLRGHEGADEVVVPGIPERALPIIGRSKEYLHDNEDN